MFDKEELIKIVFKNINLGGLFADALDEVLEQALQKIVKDTENTWDDSLIAIYPLLSDQLKKLVEYEIAKMVKKMIGEEAPAE